MDTRPSHWAFYFLGSGLHLSFSGTWSDSKHMVHITLQELWAVAVMVHRMAFHFLVRWLPYIWIMVQLKLISVSKVVQYFSMSSNISRTAGCQGASIQHGATRIRRLN